MAAFPAGALTVLVVDPDIAQQQFLARILAPRFRVITAGSIAEATQKIMAQRPQILLTEIDLPDGDGKAFIRQIRENPVLRAMIIGCITQRAAIRDKVDGFHAGADDYVVKPVNPETFMWRVILLTRMR